MTSARESVIRTRPLQIRADRQCRLQVPSLIRRMIGVKAGSKFNLFITEEGDLYFSKAEKCIR